MKCIFTKDVSTPQSLPEPFHIDNLDDCMVFPEKYMSMDEQRCFMPSNYSQLFVITNSPFIVGCFKRTYVLVKKGISTYEQVDVETYGASFEYLYKHLNKSTSVLPQIVVDEIRDFIDISRSTALDYVNCLGESMEKSYLLRKLSTNN